MKIGERIREIRKAQGLTQKELGHRLGLSYQSIAQWENGLRSPKLETILKIAQALGVRMEDLTGLETFDTGKRGNKGMIIHAEFRELANACDNIRATAEKLKRKIDISDMGLFEVYLCKGCTERDGHLFQDGKQLDNCGVQFNQYYLQQFHGFCEDSYYGTMYFKTTTPGEFVAVPFYS